MEIYPQLVIDHPRIIKCYGWFSDKYYAHIVFQYIEGSDLFEYRQCNRLSISDTKNITVQLLDVFMYLKSKWVVHRDIKPENILIDKYKNVYLCDFGFALIMDPSLSTIKTDKIEGTTEYLSPEIFMLKKIRFLF
jgi:serine/threonine protein kinase